MKIYKLSFCNSAYVEIPEDRFKKFDKCKISISTGDIIEGVSFQMDDITLKHPVLVTTPVENFEVLDESN